MKVPLMTFHISLLTGPIHALVALKDVKSMDAKMFGQLDIAGTFLQAEAAEVLVELVPGRMLTKFIDVRREEATLVAHAFVGRKETIFSQ